MPTVGYTGIVFPPSATLAYGLLGRLVAATHGDADVRTSATPPAVPGVPTNVWCDGDAGPSYLHGFSLPVRHWPPPCSHVCPAFVSVQSSSTVTVLAPGLAMSAVLGTVHTPLGVDGPGGVAELALALGERDAADGGSMVIFHLDHGPADAIWSKIVWEQHFSASQEE